MPCVIAKDNSLNFEAFLSRPNLLSPLHCAVGGFTKLYKTNCKAGSTKRCKMNFTMAVTITDWKEIAKW